MSKRTVDNFIIEIIDEEFPIVKINTRPGFRATKKSGNFEIDFIDIETEGILFKSKISSNGGWSRCSINDKKIRIEIRNNKKLVVFSEVLNKKYENGEIND